MRDPAESRTLHRKIAYLVHRDTAEWAPQLELARLDWLAAFLDPIDADLISVIEDEEIALESRTGEAVLTVRGVPGATAEARTLWPASGEEQEFGHKLSAALDWWPSHSYWLAPVDRAFAVDPRFFPNVRTSYPDTGSVLQDFTEYPSRLAKLVAAYPGEVGLFALRLRVTLPSRWDEQRASRRWAQGIEAELVRRSAPTADRLPWQFAHAQRYRGALMPLPDTLVPCATKHEAEELAAALGGPCFVVNSLTGQAELREPRFEREW